MSTQHALTKFVGPIKVAGVEGSGCLGHHRAPVRIHGSGGRSRRHGCLEQPPFTGCLHDPQGSVSGGGGMKGPTELATCQKADSNCSCLETGSNGLFMVDSRDAAHTQPLGPGVLPLCLSCVLPALSTLWGVPAACIS